MSSMCRTIERSMRRKPVVFKDSKKYNRRERRFYIFKKREKRVKDH